MHIGPHKGPYTPPSTPKRKLSKKESSTPQSKKRKKPLKSNQAVSNKIFTDGVLESLKIGRKKFSSTLAHFFKPGESLKHRAIRRAIFQNLYDLDLNAQFLTPKEWGEVNKLVGSTIYKEITLRHKKHLNAYTTGAHETHSERLIKGKDHTNHVIQGSNSIMGFLEKNKGKISDKLKALLHLLLECTFILEEDENTPPKKQNHTADESKHKSKKPKEAKKSKYWAKYLKKFDSNRLVSDSDFKLLKPLTEEINLDNYITKAEKGVQRKLSLPEKKQ
ncbi:hypothetical protein DID73_00225 [Candidatus Marinamargulisbacteria bacterium SCGC AG-343-K17]|nr:hypothetical protein DID73_00225 [Candidatus Marinamargulisbacteria bacterium SCGC AG-343-K17]